MNASQGGMFEELQSRLSGAVSGAVREVPRGRGERGMVRFAVFDGDSGIAGGRNNVERAVDQQSIQSTGGRRWPSFIVEKLSCIHKFLGVNHVPC